MSGRPAQKKSVEEVYLDMSGHHLIRSSSEKSKSKGGTRSETSRRISDYILPSRKTGNSSVRTVPGDALTNLFCDRGVSEISLIHRSVSKDQPVGGVIDIDGSGFEKHTSKDLHDSDPDLFGNGLARFLSQGNDAGQLPRESVLRRYPVEISAKFGPDGNCYPVSKKLNNMNQTLTGDNTLSRHIPGNMAVGEQTDKKTKIMSEDILFRKMSERRLIRAVLEESVTRKLSDSRVNTQKSVSSTDFKETRIRSLSEDNNANRLSVRELIKSFSGLENQSSVKSTFRTLSGNANKGLGDSATLPRAMSGNSLVKTLSGDANRPTGNRNVCMTVSVTSTTPPSTKESRKTSASPLNKDSGYIPTCSRMSKRSRNRKFSAACAPKGLLADNLVRTLSGNQLIDR